MDKKQKMPNSINKKIFVLVIIWLLIIPGLNAVAQDISTAKPAPVTIDQNELSSEILMDENITAEDMGIAEPKLLPTSFYYPVKNIWRSIRTTFIFNPVKKAEIKLRFANEKLIEAKKVAEKADQPEITAKALENYHKEMTDISKIIEKVPEKFNAENKNFAEKIIDNSFKQQKLIDYIEKKLSPEQFEKINKVREDGTQNMATAIANLVPPDEIQKKITKVIDEQKGSNFKNFKNLEILKAVEEKVPESARPAIQLAQANAQKQLFHNIIRMNKLNQEKFEKYVNQLGGNETRHLEIIDNFIKEEMPENTRKKMEKVKGIAIQRVEDKMKKLKNNEQKEEFLSHLTKGKMKNLRLVNELENNLSPEMADKILETKNKALDNFRQNFEELKTPEEQKKFLQKMDKLHDVKQLQVLNEIEEVIPEEKKELFEKLKIQTMNNIKDDINQAEDTQHKIMILQKIASDNPEDMKIIKEFNLPSEIMNEILGEQAKKLDRKIRTTQDITKLQSLKERIDNNDAVKEELKKRMPGIFKQVNEKVENNLKKIGKEQAADQLEKANNELTKVEAALNKFLQKQKLANRLKQSLASAFIKNSKKHLANAKIAFDSKKYGEAFGQAISALRNTNNVWRIIKKIELREEIGQKRIIKIEEMLKTSHAPTGTPSSAESKSKTISTPATPIRLNLDKTNLTPEQIKKISDLKQKLPIEIQQKLRDIPIEMLPDAMEKLNFKNPVGLPNPASKFCIEKGGKLETKTDSNGGQFAICHLPDGTVCEEWALFRGKGKCLQKISEEKSLPTQSENQKKINLKQKILRKIITDKLKNFRKKTIPITPQANSIKTEPCIQVLTPAKNPKTNECKIFPTPCNVPEGWIKVKECPKQNKINSKATKKLKTIKAILKIPSKNLTTNPSKGNNNIDKTGQAVPIQTTKPVSPEPDGNNKIFPEGSIAELSIFQKIKNLFKQ